MRRLTADKKGLTLVELLVAVAVLSMIMAGAFTVLTTGIKAYNINYTSTVGQQNLRTAMVQITRQVRNAAAGTVAITGSRVLTVNSKSFTVSSGKLIYDGKVLAGSISSIVAGYTDASHDVIQVDLTSADGNTLSTQIRVN